MEWGDQRESESDAIVRFSFIWVYEITKLNYAANFLPKIKGLCLEILTLYGIQNIYMI